MDHEPVLYLHWHHEMEFLVLVQGEITVHMEDRSYVLQAGDGFLFRLGCFITPIVGQKSAGVLCFCFIADVLVPRV